LFAELPTDSCVRVAIQDKRPFNVSISDIVDRKEMRIYGIKIFANPNLGSSR